MDQEFYTYVQASLAKYFQNIFVEKGKLYLLGMVRPEEATLVNFGIEEYQSNECSKGEFEAYLSLSILVQTAFDANILSKDLYVHQGNIGLISKSFLSSLPIYKYGVNGDGSFLGCIQQVVNAQGQGVVATDYGQLNSNIKVFQATVESRYRYCDT